MANIAFDLTQLEKLRPLGALEIFSSARHHLGFYHNVGISASYKTQSLTVKNLKPFIFSALASVIEKHPILSAIVVDEDSNTPYFARLPSFNLKDAVTFLTRKVPIPEVGRDIELDAILEDQHNRGFKEQFGKLPFWRLIVTTAPGVENEFMASYIFHHALGDGTSGMVFHQDFLHGLQTQSDDLKSMIIIPTKLPLLPTLEQANPFATPPTAARYTPTNLWTGNKIAPPTRTHYGSFVLSARTSASLIQACRANDTTLTATLPVLIAVAITNSLPTSATFDELECTIPISLRRFLPSPVNESEMGIWIDAFSSYFRRSDVLEFSWAEARRSRLAILDVLKPEGREVNILGLNKVEDMREYFLSKIGKERTSSFNVSNVGGMKVISVDKVGWQMGRMVFSRSAFVAGSAIDVGVVTGPDGCIVLGFCWQEDVVTEDLVGEVMKSVQNGIQSVVTKV